MAQRATGFKRSAAKLSRSAGALETVADEAPRQRSIPLNLAPLIAPYKKKKGRLSLRVERLPQLARLSAGRNKGDGCWSLATDELEDLNYLIPESVHDAHTLVIRIISLDGDTATTVAAVDFLVSPGAQAAGERDAPTLEVAASGGNVDLQRLRDELAGARAALCARDAEIAQIRQSAERAEKALVQRQTGIDPSELEATFKAQLDARLAAARDEAAAELARAKADWDAAHGTSSADAEASLAQMRERWQSEADDALRKAEQAWKADETARFIAAEKKWRDQFTKAVSEAKAKAAGPEKGEAKLRRLQEQLTALQATLADREAALARTSLDAEQAQARWQTEAEAAIAKAEQRWKVKEAARLAASEAQWQEKVARAIADARADAVASRGRDADAEIAIARETLAALETELATREAAVAKAHADHEDAREQWAQQTRETLAKAEHAWKVAEAERTVATESRWQERLSKSVAALQAELAERDKDTDDRVARLQKKLTALEATLAERDEELAKLRAANEEALARTQREAREALAAAEHKWKLDTAERFTVVEAQWREDAARNLAAANARYEQAESALADLRAKAESDLSDARTKAESDLSAARTKAESDLIDARAKAESELSAIRVRAENNLADVRTKAETDLAELRTKSETALAELRSKAENAAAAARAESEEQIRLLHEERIQLQAQIAHGNNVLAQARLDADQAYQNLRRETQTQMKEAKAAWDAEKAVLLAEADDNAKREYAAALADATGRFQAAEAALAQVRIRSAATKEFTGSSDVRRLEHERELLQAALGQRELEVAQLRATMENNGVRVDDRIHLRTNQEIAAAERALMQRPRRLSNRMIFGGLAAAAAVIAAIFIVPSFFGSSSTTETSRTAEISAPGDAGAPARIAPTPSRAAAGARFAVAQNANIRATASTTGKLIVTLPKGTPVTVAGVTGEWSHVRTVDGSKDGWVHTTLLKPLAAQAVPAEARTPARANRRRRASAQTEASAAPSPAPAEQPPASEPAPVPAP